MKKTVILLIAILLAGCGGGGDSDTPSTLHSVTISWTANRESGVNSAGGGYTVTIGGQSPIDVPYVSGAAAPTSTTVELWSGTYSVTVQAYAALDADGGSSGSTSASSTALTVRVP